MHKGLLVYLCLLSPTLHAEDNLEQAIAFSGDIQASSCILSLESRNQVIQMQGEDELKTVDFTSKAIQAITPFSIVLEECLVFERTAKTVRIRFSSPAGTDLAVNNTYINLEKEGQLKNLGLAIRGKNQSNLVKLDGSEAFSHALKNGIITLEFESFLRRISEPEEASQGANAVTGGSFSQPVNFTLEYP